MANTICLSTDMSTLYLIAGDGNTTSFDLSGFGVNVSLSGGDVTASAARSAASGTQDSYSKTNGQYTVYFDDTANAMEFIGIADMITFREKAYSLSGNAININISGNNIIVTS